MRRKRKDGESTGPTGLLVLNCGIMVQHGVALLIVGPLVPSLMEAFGIGEATTGFLLAMGSVGFLMGPLVAGTIIDRLNIRVALLVGLVLEIVFFALFGTAGLFALVIFANFMFHLGTSFVETSANVLPTLIPRKGSAHARMNLIHVFFSIGAFTGPFLVGLYIARYGVWRPVLFFALIPTILIMLWVAFARFPVRSRHRDRAGRLLSDIAVVVRSRSAVFGAISLLLYVGAEVGLSAWIVYYLLQILGFSTILAASGLSILWIFIMIGRFLNSLLGNRFTAKTLVTVSGIGGCVGVLAFIFARSMPIAYMLLAWIGLCLSGVFPNIMAELNNREPGRTGTVTAVMSTGAAFGAAAFQWIVGIIADTVSLQAAFALLALLQILVVGSFLLALAPD